MRIKLVLILIIIPTLFVLYGCASYDFSRRTVQQGNLLPHSKIERLKLGMTKHDAAILMGTSLLSPLFDNNRWDYAYTTRVANQPMKIRRVSLYFKNGRLNRIVHQPDVKED